LTVPRRVDVTLYIPCYNAAAFIEQCLEAVFAMEVQPAEVLVIDDGSRDDTARRAGRFPVRIVPHGKNKGLSAARNTGFREARYELVAALDADCVPAADWLARLLDRMGDERLAGVGGRLVERFQRDVGDLWRAVHMRQHWGDREVLDPEFLFGNNNVYRRSAVLGVGGFDERYRTNYEDVDMGRRLRRANYSLLYDPRARVEHLRRDTARSVLRTFWRWTVFDECEPTTARRLVRKCRINLRKAKDFFYYDWTDGHLRLLPLDLAMPLVHGWHDLRHYVRSSEVPARE